MDCEHGHFKIDEVLTGVFNLIVVSHFCQIEIFSELFHDISEAETQYQFRLQVI